MPTFRFTRWRLLVGLAILPVFDALLGYILFPVWWSLRDEPAGLADSNQGAVPFAAMFGLMGLFVTVTAVLPVVFWLRKSGPLTIRRLIVAGAVVGNLPLTVVTAATIALALAHLATGTLQDHLSSPSELLAAWLRIILLGSFAGAVSGAFFWLVALSGRHEYS